MLSDEEILDAAKKSQTNCGELHQWEFAHLIEAKVREATLEEAAKENKRLREIVEQLWNIIDDIDTYDDAAKSNDSLFRQWVEKRQRDRWNTGITTDGYALNFDSALKNGEAV